MLTREHANMWKIRMLLWSAALGSATVAGIWMAALNGAITLGPIELLVCVAVLVVVPLGFYHATENRMLAEQPAFRLAVIVQPFAALLAAASLGVGPGIIGAALAVPWVAVCVLASLGAVIDRRRLGLGGLADCSALGGLMFLPVGGCALVLSRAGLQPGGFQEPLVLLTAVHFHYTGFAAPILFSLTLRRLKSLRIGPLFLFNAATIGLLAGTPLLALGFVVSPVLKFAAALLLVLSVGTFIAAAFVLLPRLRPTAAQILLGVSAISPLASMLLAGIYAFGEFCQRAWISISQMAASHGVLSGLGFVVCGLVGFAVAGPLRPTAASNASPADFECRGGQ